MPFMTHSDTSEMGLILLAAGILGLHIELTLSQGLQNDLNTCLHSHPSHLIQQK